MAITNAQQARQLYKNGSMKKIKGQDHMLAYITPGERDMLVDLGGQETMTKEGILAYPPGGGDGPMGGGGDKSGNQSGGGGNNNRERGAERNRSQKTPGMSPGRSMAQFGHAGHAGKTERKAKSDQRSGRGVPDNASSSAKNPYSGHNPNEIPSADKNKDGKIGPIEKTNQFLINKTTPFKKRGLRKLIDYIGAGRKFQVPSLMQVFKGPKLEEEDYLGLENVSPLQLQAMFGKNIVGTMDEEKIRDISGVLGQDTVTQKEFEQFYPNMNPPPERGGNNNIIPISPTTTSSLTPVEEEVDDRTELEKLFEARGPAYRFFADGGRVPAMAGGIMNTDVIGGAADGNIDEMGRQMYFIGKLVKKASNAVKKIVKSPVGKIALLTAGAGLFGAGPAASLFGSGKGLAFKNFLGKGLLKKGMTDFSLANISPMKAIGLASLTPFLFPGQEEEEEQQYEGPSIDIPGIRRDPYRAMGETYRFLAEGGKAEPVAKKTMPLIDMDGKEMDLRDEGGFVPLGRMERADDVPARLSKNEFVFTADAVRNAGEGDIDKGAEVMYNMMKNLESGGEVSEESQGLDGAREMFKTSQRLEEVL